MRGPKRASKIRKLFNLTKGDDVTKYVNTYRRSFESKNGKLRRCGGACPACPPALHRARAAARMHQRARWPRARVGPGEGPYGGGQGQCAEQARADAAGKKHSKTPKIQRLVTPLTLQVRAALRPWSPLVLPFSCGAPAADAPIMRARLTPRAPPPLPLFCSQRKRHHMAVKKRKQEKTKADAAEYHKLLMARLKEQRERRSESLAKKRALRSASVASKEQA
jgi:hypothetical protein